MKRQKYKEIEIEMRAAINNPDAEAAHLKADELLKQVALHTGLRGAQRDYLIILYDKVKKHYA